MSYYYYRAGAASASAKIADDKRAGTKALSNAIALLISARRGSISDPFWFAFLSFSLSWVMTPTLPHTIGPKAARFGAARFSEARCPSHRLLLCCRGVVTPW